MPMGQVRRKVEEILGLRWILENTQLKVEIVKCDLSTFIGDHE